MSVHANKNEGNKSQSLNSNNGSKKSTNNTSTFQFVDNRPETAQMKELQEMANESLQVKEAVQLKTIQKEGIEEEELLQGKFETIQQQGLEEEELLQGKFKTVQRQQIGETTSAINTKPIQKKENNTGLPDNLKSGIEHLSGYGMDDVKVHYNSDQPAQLNAHAYAQGTDIHLASGQEKHLPHEAWHVVQQKQGRVQPTMQMKGKVNINDDVGLEKEADVMGAKAAQLKKDSTSLIASPIVTQRSSKEIIQRAVQVQGAAQTVDQVTAHFDGTPDALTLAQVQILQSWSDSATVHNFRPSQGRTGWAKIPLALGRAEAMPNDAPPALFTAANLQFITQSGDRLATYYFSSGGQTGRLRQQHKSGPLASIDPQVNVRISFANRDHRTAFVNALRTSRTNGAAFVDPNPGLWNPPAVGQHLLEYHLAGGVAVGWHPSGGLIQNVPAAQNNNAAIAAIYNNIIGVADIADPGGGLFGCCFITTACVISKGLPDDCEELEILRDYRDNYLLKREYGQELFNFYYTYSPSIVEGINSQPDVLEIYEYLYTVIQSCVGSIRRKDLEEAFRIYVEMVLMLRDSYTPETKIPLDLNTILQKSLQ